nr:MAG TPA: hypothetical protein [Caudoviricetes sp.]
MKYYLWMYLCLFLTAALGSNLAILVYYLGYLGGSSFMLFLTIVMMVWVKRWCMMHQYKMRH